ncbi:hypothetical protein DFH07DRAFT_935329 [Mycena maculata]|uniref:Uncharacterized protein n=1 Tax=Mycena maculata TaxID=230809 RepID=A0AAD7KE84_9AGAR|nr:hypothetical protein DFH07DRAFT_935329 [Mycena maculata]
MGSTLLLFLPTLTRRPTPEMSTETAIQGFAYSSATKPFPEPPIKTRRCAPPPIYIPERRLTRPLPPLPMPPVALALAPSVPASPSKRSLTQRHIHNYSLPSPASPTTPRPTKCQSSPTLSDFRQAVYIPGTIPEAKDVSVRGPRAPRHDCLLTVSTDIPETVEVGTRTATPALLRAAASDSGISLLAYMEDEQSSSSTRQTVASRSPPISPTASSPRCPGTSPLALKKAKLDQPKLNRLSALSIASLPFPLPTPPGLTSDFKWEVDPFAAASSSSPTDVLQSKWSPASSTLSLAHQPNPSDIGSKKEDKSSPTKLKDFFGRLSITRGPAASGFHFRSASATIKYGEAQEKRRRNSLMAFFIVDEEKEDPGPLTKNVISAQNDDADILGTPKLRSDPHILGPGEPGTTLDFLWLALISHATVLCSPVTDLCLDVGDLSWTPTYMNPVSTAILVSSSASISKQPDVDGMAVNTDRSIVASIQTPLREHLHGSSSYSPPPSKILAGSPDMPPSGDDNTRTRPRPDQSRALVIPRIRPPRPQKPSSPPYASNSVVVPVLDLGFPSPPALAQHLSSTSQSGEDSEMQRRRSPSIPPPSPSRQLLRLPASADISPLQVQKPSSVGGACSSVPVNRPPAVPPRSRLRPPPVKITNDFRSTRRRDSQPQERASPTHSRSSSIASLTISPLPSPPFHSHSSSVASFMVSPMPTPPQHSYSSSVASSFMISPMPTPPPLSPGSPLSTSVGSGSSVPPPLPRVRPVTPEPQIDMGLLRALIMQRFSENDSECESEAGESSSSEDHDESSTCTATIPEFAWQEEPRSPPSQRESPEEIHTSSDIEDDDAASIYSQFSAAYTFRSRSVRRPTDGRLSKRSIALSMMSVYSQASISSEDTDMPPIPSLPWSLRGDHIPEESVAESDLGDMTFNAPQYAYAYSLNDYVGHDLEGAALAGRVAGRSGAELETELPSTRTMSDPAASNEDSLEDWRFLLTGGATSKGKRRTSSNISVVENEIPAFEEPEHTSQLALTDRGSITTNGNIGNVSTTSTLTPMSPRTLAPNRRQRTVRRGTTMPYSPRSNYQSPSATSVNFIFDPEAGQDGWRRETPSEDTMPLLSPQDTTKKARGVRSGLQGVKSRVNVLKSHLVSLTAPSSRSPSSVNFPAGISPDFYDRGPRQNPSSSPFTPPSPSASPRWPSTSVSPSVSSSSSSLNTSAETSPPNSAYSSWTPGSTNRDVNAMRSTSFAVAV